MADANQEPIDDGLKDLPEAARKETESIIKEIADDAQKVDKPKEEPEKPKDPPHEEKKPEAKKPEDSKVVDPVDPKKPEEESRKKAKLMPAWQHEIEKGKWEKERAELEAKLAAAGKNSREEKKEDTSEADRDAALRKETDKIAEETNIDPDAAFRIAKVAQKGVKPAATFELPPETKATLEKVDKYAADQETQAEERAFNSDFEAVILPLVKAEYGDDVPATAISKIKDQVKAKAYTDEYSRVPLATIYKGEDEFRKVVPGKADGAEKSRGGHQEEHERKEPKGVDLSKELSDDEVAKLSPEEFDTYSNNMGRRK